VSRPDDPLANVIGTGPDADEKGVEEKEERPKPRKPRDG
jgi:hypothetical protein